MAVRGVVPAAAILPSLPSIAATGTVKRSLLLLHAHDTVHNLHKLVTGVCALRAPEPLPILR